MKRKLVLAAGAACVALLVAAVARAESRSGSGEGSTSARPTGAEPPARKPAPRPRSSGFAPDAAKTAARSDPTVREERNVLRKVAAASLFNTRAGTLALGKGSSPAVRSFAAGLVEHHKEGQVDMLRLLHARGMAMPMLDNAQSQLLRRLERTTGKQFDREFLQAVGVESLRRELRLLESATLSVKDPALKAWVERSLPGLRQQLAVAERTSGTGPRTALGSRGGAASAGAPGAVTPVGTRLSGSNTR